VLFLEVLLIFCRFGPNAVLSYYVMLNVFLWYQFTQRCSVALELVLPSAVLYFLYDIGIWAFYV
jgi:hypothetical protein